MTAPNLIVSVSSKPKHGKSHLALTFPEPLLVFSFDIGLDPVLKKFPNKAIEVKTYPIPIVDSDPPKPYAEPIWTQFNLDYKEAIESGVYATVVVDTATALWEIVRHAITEERNRKKLLEIEYALPNIKMSGLFAQPRVTGVNLVVTQYLRDRYVNGENTGQLELDGWKRTEGQADIVLEIERITQTSKVGKKSVMETTIKDNRYDRDLNGIKLIDTTYDEILALVIGDDG